MAWAHAHAAAVTAFFRPQCITRRWGGGNFVHDHTRTFSAVRRSSFLPLELPDEYTSGRVGTLHIYGAVRLGKSEWALAQFDNRRICATCAVWPNDPMGRIVGRRVIHEEIRDRLF